MPDELISKFVTTLFHIMVYDIDIIRNIEEKLREYDWEDRELAIEIFEDEPKELRERLT